MARTPIQRAAGPCRRGLESPISTPMSIRVAQIRWGGGSPSWLCQEAAEPEQAGRLAAPPGWEASGCPTRANLQPWVQ